MLEPVDEADAKGKMEESSFFADEAALNSPRADMDCLCCLQQGERKEREWVEAEVVYYFKLPAGGKQAFQTDENFLSLLM